MEPYKEKKRERRIRNRFRMIAKGRRYWLESHYFPRFNGSKSRFVLHEAEMYGRYRHDNLCICSCDMCGNPRHSKYYSGKSKLTFQEYQALIDEKEQIDEQCYNGPTNKKKNTI